MAVDRDRAVTGMQVLAARIAAVVGLIQFTVWGLALVAASGISTFVVAVGLIGDWSRDALVFALVVGGVTAIAPVILGAGESLLQGIDLPKLGYEVSEHVPSEGATHVVFTRRS